MLSFKTLLKLFTIKMWVLTDLQKKLKDFFSIIVSEKHEW
jgi:hypothetical protein